MKSKINAFNPNHNLMTSDTFEIYHYKQPYFKSLDFHNHDFYEIYIFLDGSVTYYIEEKVYTLCAGDILVIPAGKMHRLVTNKPDAIYERVVIWLNRNFIHEIDNDAQSIFSTLSEIEQRRQYLYSIPQENIDFMSTVLDKLVSLDLSQSGEYMILQRSYIIILLFEIRTMFIANPNHDNSHQISESNTIPNIIQYINEHITEQLTLEKISNLFFVSKYHLIRKFKSYTNSTVYDYIIAKRIIFAKSLLRDGLSATDACMQCGFLDYSNFYKSFQAKTGMTPSEFKANFIRKS